MRRLLIPTTIAVLVLPLSACNRAAEEELVITTTTEAIDLPLTPIPTAVSTTTIEGSSSTTRAAGTVIESYDIRFRSSSDEGETLLLVIPEADYTDRNLEGFIAELVDEEKDVHEAHVFDNLEAVNAFRVEEADRTAEETALLDEHYLVSLTDGNVVTFHGPFADMGSFLLGS